MISVSGKALLMSEQHPQHDDISTLLALFSSETPATCAESEINHAFLCVTGGMHGCTGGGFQISE